MGRVMDSQFGEVFLFLTKLAWKCRITLPVLVTAAFMVMDIRLQIEINIQTRQIAEDMDDFIDTDDSDDSWETVDSEDELYEDENPAIHDNDDENEDGTQTDSENSNETPLVSR